MNRLDNYTARIVADTIGAKTGSRITTFELLMPKYLVAEFNTHRTLSRNSASSRAIPTSALIKRVWEADLLPIDWREKNIGMESHTQLSPEDSNWYDAKWLWLRNTVIDGVQEMLDRVNTNGTKGADKQRINRALEPWMPTVIVTTATEWENFFTLRNSPHAQPEFGYIAKLMQEAYEGSKPQEAYWHYPYIKPRDCVWHNINLQGIKGIKGLHPINAAIMLTSAARCGRVSYYRQGDTKSVEEDIQRGLSFAQQKHWSPLEHTAKDQGKKWYGNFYGWKQLRKFFPEESGATLK